MRKYDAIAISLLMFSVILVTAISIDPKGFSLKEWQPIMAAILALGGAIVIGPREPCAGPWPGTVLPCDLPPKRRDRALRVRIGATLVSRAGPRLGT
jgi:hypothetical protein